MPRRETPFVPDLYYHIYNRGNNRQAVFFQPENYLYFLRGVKRYIRPAANIVAYCLMPTHYHLLVRVQQTSEFSENPGVSKAMMRLSVSYTKAINKRFERVGSLFQGQFQAKAVKRYSHLLNLCAYIHANPVKDGLTAMPEDWLYSNYLEWLGRRDGTLVDHEFIREHFNSPDEYQEFMAGYLKSRRLPDEVSSYLQSLED